MIGVEQFYLYVDPWVSDETKAAIQVYVDAGLVTVIPWNNADKQLGDSLTEGASAAPQHDHRV